MTTVSADDICAAIRDSFVDTRVVIEPAGALALAGLRKYVSRTKAVRVQVLSPVGIERKSPSPARLR